MCTGTVAFRSEDHALAAGIILPLNHAGAAGPLHSGDGVLGHIKGIVIGQNIGVLPDAHIIPLVLGMNDPDGEGMILAPESKGTRAQIATMMMRFCTEIVK